jgi:hypothetical protein
VPAIGRLVLCQGCACGSLGSNEVSPQLRKAGGELPLVPSHPQDAPEIIQFRLSHDHQPAAGRFRVDAG